MKKKICIAITVFSLALGLFWEFIPELEPSPKLHQIPLEGVNFRGREIRLTDVEKGAIGKASAIKRNYVFNGRGFLLTVVDGSRNRSAVHDPAYCHKGSSSRVEDGGALRLSCGVGRLLRVGRQDGSTLEVMTWFSHEHRQFPSFFRYWALSTLNRLSCGKAGAEPLLVTVRSVSEDGSPVDWSRAIDEFFPQLGL